MTNDPPRAYLAGPDLCHPQSSVLIKNKKLICAKYGLEGVAADDAEVRLEPIHRPDAGIANFNAILNLLADCDVVIANMIPFRGPSMDVGAAFEIGYMTALGRPVVGYTSDQQHYAARVARLHEVIHDALVQKDGILCTPDGLAVEDFKLTDNFMVVGAALNASAAIAEDFESAVRWARRLVVDD